MQSTVTAVNHCRVVVVFMAGVGVSSRWCCSYSRSVGIPVEIIGNETGALLKIVDLSRKCILAHVEKSYCYFFTDANFRVKLRASCQLLTN